MILSFWLRLCRTASLPLCDIALTAFVGFKCSEHTCSTFLLPFTLYRWTESVTCTGSSLFAVGYAYSERHRKYSSLLPFRLRQTDLNPRHGCQWRAPTPARFLGSFARYRDRIIAGQNHATRGKAW